jgi:hypothetical protein
MKASLPEPVHNSAAPPSEIIDSRSERRKDILVLGVLALLATIFFADVLAGFNHLYLRDLTRFYYPSKQILRQVVKNGEFPYWNRYYSAGQPIAANPEYEIFYPPTWLILLPNFDLGYRLLILLHIYVALFGMYGLLRSMELRRFAAFVGAFAFGQGGLVLSYVNLLPILFCAAWIPFTFLYVRRFLLHRRFRDFALGSLFLGLQFLVGEPTTILQTGALLGCYALYRGWYSTPRLVKSIKGILWVGLICASGLMIGAVQMLPALDHVHDSVRSRAFDFNLVTAWSFPAARLAELVYPNILGHITIDGVTRFWGASLYPSMGSPFLYSIYSGLLLIALSIGGAFARPRGGRLVLSVVLLSVVIAMGGHTPLFRFLYDHGIVTSIRYPEKFLLLGLFVLIVFGSQMFDRLLAGDRQIRDGAIGFVLATTIMAAIFAALSFTQVYQTTVMNILGVRGPSLAQTVSTMRSDWAVAVLRGSLLTVLLVFAYSRRARTWIILTTLFLVVDLGLIAHEITPRMPGRFFDPPAVVQQFPPNRPDYRIFHEADWQSNDENGRNYLAAGAGNYWVVRNGLFPETQAQFGLSGVIERDYDMTALLPTADFTSAVGDVRQRKRADWPAPFMAMSNAWFHGVYQPFADENDRSKGDFTNSTPILFEEGPHWPRYYFSDQVVTIRDRADFVNKLAEQNYSPQVAFISAPAFTPSRGQVISVVETANSATLEVESFGQGFLVMSVTPHKYWHIEVSDVDGRNSQAVPAVVTNIGYQGIIVPSGRHRVTMAYRNPLVRFGGLISVVALLVLALLAVFLRHTPALENSTREELVAPI